MSEKGFKNFLSTGTVYVVGAGYNKTFNCMTAAWVTKTSHNPTIVAVSVSPERYTHNLIRDSKRFSLNALSDKQLNLSKHFGSKSGRDTDKMKDVEWHKGKYGTPILDEVLAWGEFEVIDQIVTGDHTLFIGELLDGELSEPFKPLLFSKEDYY